MRFDDQSNRTSKPASESNLESALPLAGALAPKAAWRRAMKNFNFERTRVVIDERGTFAISLFSSRPWGRGRVGGAARNPNPLIRCAMARWATSTPTANRLTSPAAATSSSAGLEMDAHSIPRAAIPEHADEAELPYTDQSTSQALMLPFRSVAEPQAPKGAALPGGGPTFNLIISMFGHGHGARGAGQTSVGESRRSQYCEMWALFRSKPL